MSNELVIREEDTFINLGEDMLLLSKVARQLMETKHYQSLGEAGIFAVLQKAKALKIDPVDALNGSLYCVQGKIGMSTELMTALIRRAGHSVVKDPKSDDTICILHGKRIDSGDTWTTSFSWADAKRANLDKGMFLKYPAIMLYNRAMSALARQLFPDVIKGCGYGKDELYEIANNSVKDCQPGVATFDEKEIEIKEPTPPAEVKVVDDVMVKHLMDLLNKDQDYREKTEEFVLETFNVTSFKDLSYDNFVRIFKEARKYFKAIEEKDSERRRNKELDTKVQGPILAQ